jgi:ribose 5-phosphate isomerase A
MSTANKQQVAKEVAGKAAADLIEQGMLVGLGSGSTSFCFISSLIERCAQGLKITAVSTSKKSMEQAKAGNIPIVDINSISHIDVAVDGADEIDKKKRMIKGGGGALLREKIVAGMSQEMIVIVDESKIVDELGKFPLPIEICSFGYNATSHHLKELGYEGKWRKTEDEKFYLTENNNYIFDINFPHSLKNPEIVNQQIKNVPGVIETGFFFNLAGRVVIGYSNGDVQIHS